MGAYRCPRPACDEKNEFEFDTAEERHDHLVNDHGEEYADVEPFDPGRDCSTRPGISPGTGRCPMTNPCVWRCHIRFLDGQNQPNDAWADDENAAAWRRYYDANPGAEEAARASCDPKTYEEQA